MCCREARSARSVSRSSWTTVNRYRGSEDAVFTILLETLEISSRQDVRVRRRACKSSLVTCPQINDAFSESLSAPAVRAMFYSIINFGRALSRNVRYLCTLYFSINRAATEPAIFGKQFFPSCVSPRPRYFRYLRSSSLHSLHLPRGSCNLPCFQLPRYSPSR